ncbi:hypothetical protein [Calycomorphotria hydatis]|uniref:Uncharacterized protein n=1 Tax=Calycomorphotria hydatis TaxID=2528027 RepID=A0A517TC18_9PLAN|nr:hypothetical protein [Calycomorphotria hydatis]QDT65909.1 hypothetical protein V22_31720 [Calycomorphotria hydatis]
MARKAPSRMELRRAAEAAEAAGDGDDGEEKPKAKTKRATARKTTTRRARTKEEPRKRMMWAIFSGSMKEEARFSYGERDQAEEKLEQLRAKSTKKLYFIQPLKVPLTDPTASVSLADMEPDEDEVVATKPAAASEEE